jgi:DNA-binding NarL/FixJ family response regulator
MVYEFPEGRVIVVMKPAPQEVTDIELRQLFPLTRRESEVATLLLQRLTNKEIAATLGVAQSTAWHHTQQVLTKTACYSRRNLASIVRERLRSGCPSDGSR